MNSHKNARLTYVRRIEMVQDITQRGLSAPQAGARLASEVAAGSPSQHLPIGTSSTFDADRERMAGGVVATVADEDAGWAHGARVQAHAG